MPQSELVKRVVQALNLDLEYRERWVETLTIGELWQRLKGEAETVE